MQRIIQTLDLMDTDEARTAYLKAHDEIWPEIVSGIREVGIDRMDLYLHGNRVVMIVEMPDDVDFDQAMTRLAGLPRQQEWEESVGQYQQCDPGSTAAWKWKRMNKIFELP